MPPKKGKLDNKKDNEKKKEKDEPVIEPPAEQGSVVYTIPSEKPYESEDHMVDYDKYPLYFEMPKIKGGIFDTDATVNFSASIDYPKFEYGFHHFIHQGKNYFGDVVKSFEGKKQVWRVLNKYEVKVDNYEEAISDVTKKYFDLKNKPDILSRAFYKLWEILMLFDLIDLKKEKFVSAHLAEGPGSFIQATILYRDMFGKKGVSKNDKYYGVTLHPEGRSYVPEMDKKFVDFYNKESPKRLFLHKTYTKQVAGGNPNKDNGDLTDPKTMKLFGGEIISKCDLITADGGFETVNENLQEQESFRLIIAEIINAAKNQKKGGHFVCKFFETFTNSSMKVISILSELYEEVKFIKPLTSRISNSEKYVVCMKFKYDDNHKEYKKIISTLENILDIMHKNKDQFVVGLFNKYTIPKELVLSVINMNLLISNLQLKNINNIVSFIRKEIYSGDEYHDGREDQIKANEYWLDIYYPNSENFTKAKEKCKKLVDDMYKITNNRLKRLNKLKMLNN
jgi:23S rRNA U2552 (ribose-2'-O)-methylase RlmE/FtsJ